MKQMIDHYDQQQIHRKNGELRDLEDYSYP